MNQQYRIRQRIVEVSTSDPTALKADALLLPCVNLPADAETGSLLSRGGDHLLRELADYPRDRDVLITSAGNLGARFILHLTLPSPAEETEEEIDRDDSEIGLYEYVDLETLEERFRDAFFQASVLGLSDLAIPVNEFSRLTDSFSGLVAAIWRACSEFLAQDRGPRVITFLVSNRDLQGQFLRHFFKRKQSEHGGWGGEEPRGEIVAPLPAPVSPLIPHHAGIRFMNAERVLTMTPPDEDKLASKLDGLIAAYREDEDLSGPLEELIPAMQAIFSESIASKNPEDALPDRLRILGSTPVCRLPWELLPRDGEPLGDRHQLTRGTNFLHFSREKAVGGSAARGVSFRIAANQTQGRALAEELREISKRSDCDVNWNPGARGGVRLTHCIGLPAIKGLLEEPDLLYELIYLDLEPGEELRSPVDLEIDDWAREMLTQGCRRVIAPLVSFRNDRERRAFRTAFYERLLDGGTAGQALRCAQGVCRSTFGMHSGWFLNRIFGQTDEVLVAPRRSAERQGTTAESIP